MFRDMPIPSLYNNIVRERNTTPAKTLQRLREANLFVFSGHGRSEVLQCKDTGNLERKTIAALPDNALSVLEWFFAQQIKAANTQQM